MLTSWIAFWPVAVVPDNAGAPPNGFESGFAMSVFVLITGRQKVMLGHGRNASNLQAAYGSTAHIFVGIVAIRYLSTHPPPSIVVFMSGDCLFEVFRCATDIAADVGFIAPEEIWSFFDLCVLSNLLGWDSGLCVIAERDPPDRFFFHSCSGCVLSPACQNSKKSRLLFVSWNLFSSDNTHSVGSLYVLFKRSGSFFCVNKGFVFLYVVLIKSLFFFLAVGNCIGLRHFCNACLWRRILREDWSPLRTLFWFLCLPWFIFKIRSLEPMSLALTAGPFSLLLEDCGFGFFWSRIVENIIMLAGPDLRSHPPATCQASVQPLRLPRLYEVVTPLPFWRLLRGSCLDNILFVCWRTFCVRSLR